MSARKIWDLLKKPDLVFVSIVAINAFAHVDVEVGIVNYILVVVRLYTPSLWSHSLFSTSILANYEIIKKKITLIGTYFSLIIIHVTEKKNVQHIAYLFTHMYAWKQNAWPNIDPAHCNNLSCT